MPRKLYIIFTLVFMCFPQFVTSKINEKKENNQKIQKILNNHFSKYFLVGKANFQVLFWNMYDAKLVSESGKYPSNKFALILKYNREFKKDSVVDETINQLKKQKTFNAQELGKVKLLLNKAFRNIKKNNTFIGIRNDNEAIFYFEYEKVLETKNIEFIKLFFDIWLRKDSQNPKFTNKLLGLSKG